MKQPEEIQSEVGKGELEVNVIRFKQRAPQLQCIECGHVLQSDADWEFGVDRPATAETPSGEHDSGILVCPVCRSLQEETLLDGLVKFQPNGSKAGLSAYIPMDVIREFADMDGEEEVPGIRLNLGQAMLNAVKLQLIDALGSDAVAFFPNDNELIRERWG